MTKIELQSNEILVLRNCHADGSSYNGFVWPKSGYVECPDWQDDDNCGHGLHGLPWGVGSTSYFYDDADAAWIVFVTSTSAGQYRHGAGDLTDKCKARSANVIYFGDKLGAIQLLAAHLPTGLPMNFATQTAGDRSTQTAGDRSMQTAGDRSTQTAGDRSMQTAGDRSMQTAGYCSTQTAGDRSMQTAGYRPTQTAGDDSTQTAGDDSTQKAGYRSTQKAGYCSTQTAGDDSTQKAGYCSTQTAGDRSMQTAGDDSTQKAGYRSVQVVFWWRGGEWCSACRVVPDRHVNKWCKIKNGEWEECSESEAAEAEQRVSLEVVS
jgi:hypothetical protein